MCCSKAGCLVFCVKCRARLKMCAGGCTRLVAVILLLVASLALVTHFIAPYLTYRTLRGSFGLLGRCSVAMDAENIGDTFDSCTWFTDNDFEFVKNLPDWWYACQGLASFGIIFLLLAVPAGCGSLCCCKSDRLAYFTGSCISFGCLLMAIHIGVWGWGMHATYNVTPFQDSTLYGRFEWGYYLGMGGVILGWISSGLFFCSRTKHY